MFDMLIWAITIIVIIRIIRLCSKKARFRYGCWKAEVNYDKAFGKAVDEARKEWIMTDFYPPSYMAEVDGEDFYLYGPDEENLKIRDRIIYSIVNLITWLLLIVLFMSYVGQCTPNDLDERAGEALEYCKENGYSTDYCMLVDYGRHSGRVRFFLWDFEKEKPMSKPNGRKALVLYGRDKTNSNALQRGILIHPVSLPNFPIYPLLIPVKVYKVFGHKIRPKSEGCITIPFRKYKKVVQIAKTSSEPLMMWVYE